MLKSILNGEFFSQLLIITDSVENNGDSIFNAISKSHKEKIALISTKQDANRFNLNLFEWFNVFDVRENNLNEIENSVILINSISPIIWKTGVHQTCRLLKNLVNNKNKCLICRVYPDSLIESNQLNYLFHCANTFINILSCDNQNKVLLKIVTKKGGKLVQQYQNMFVDQDKLIFTNVDTKKKMTEVVPKANMDSLTTFNLGVKLNEKEKQARDNLVLPYLKKGESKILYEPDDMDYEEDPDDDLEL